MMTLATCCGGFVRIAMPTRSIGCSTSCTSELMASSGRLWIMPAGVPSWWVVRSWKGARSGFGPGRIRRRAMCGRNAWVVSRPSTFWCGLQMRFLVRWRLEPTALGVSGCSRANRGSARSERPCAEPVRIAYSQPRSLTIEHLHRGCGMGPLACRNLCHHRILRQRDIAVHDESSREMCLRSQLFSRCRAFEQFKTRALSTASQPWPN